ncbi:MAG: GNAT family N-acetyltransferase [Candidatus Bipolaricaulota bacterium]
MKPIRIDGVESYDWTQILQECQSEGHNMVNRLLADFSSGGNRFDAPGEVLLVCLSGSSVVAVAGLNREPDESLPRAGRIRRLYVVPQFRRQSLGRSLVEQIAALAEPYLNTLTANVGKPDAYIFYERLGFTPVRHRSITHKKQLARNHTMASIVA